MAEKSIFTEKEIAFLRELIRQGVPFMIVGLAAAALQGAFVVTQDIDLWFADLADPRIARALKKVGGSYIPPSHLTPPLFAGKSVELFDIVTTMNGLEEFSSEMKRAVGIPLGSVTVKALPLERIIASKESTGRQKDLLALPVLKDAAATIKAKTQIERRTRRKKSKG